ncbi:MAG: glycosyltransferase [Acetobacteraceae bacterium]|nr:glycosyltransferase [Acetobacteraceae bacterium]
MRRDRGVTFAVPLFNKAPWVRATLDSIAAQNGGFAREIVVVDDGSTDGSAEAVQEWARGRNDVVLIRQGNRGSAATSNACLAAARLPFVKFVDADDLLHPDATLLLLEALEREPGAALAYADRATFPDGTVPVMPPPPRLAPHRVEDALARIVRNSLFNPTQILVRTEAARAVGGCDERVRHSQEYGLALRLAALGPFVHVPTTLAFQRVGISGNLSADQGRQLARITLALGHFLADHPELPIGLRRLAARRAAGRAWLWRRRHLGESLLSSWSLRRLAAWLPPRDVGRFVQACADAFEPPR